MHAESELRLSEDSDGSGRESRTRVPPPYRGVSAAAQVLSGPKEVALGQQSRVL